MTGRTGGFELRGINHLALVCRDMERTVDFYTNVLGMPLVKTIELPAGMGQHFFFDCGGGDCLAFFWFPDAPDGVPGISAPAARPDQGDLTSAIGSMNHVAFDVAPEKMEEYRDRLVAAGIDCTEIANHDDSEWGISDEHALRRLRPQHLLPGSRRHPAGVRLLDARLHPHRRLAHRRPRPSTPRSAAEPELPAQPIQRLIDHRHRPMPRLRQVPKDEATAPIVTTMYEWLFEGRDPVAEPGRWDGTDRRLVDRVRQQPRHPRPLRQGFRPLPIAHSGPRPQAA